MRQAVLKIKAFLGDRMSSRPARDSISWLKREEEEEGLRIQVSDEGLTQQAWGPVGDTLVSRAPSAASSFQCSVSHSSLLGSRQGLCTEWPAKLGHAVFCAVPEGSRGETKPGRAWATVTSLSVPVSSVGRIDSQRVQHHTVCLCVPCWPVPSPFSFVSLTPGGGGDANCSMPHLISSPPFSWIVSTHVY